MYMIRNGCETYYPLWLFDLLYLTQELLWYVAANCPSSLGCWPRDVHLCLSKCSQCQSGTVSWMCIMCMLQLNEPPAYMPAKRSAVQSFAYFDPALFFPVIMKIQALKVDEGDVTTTSSIPLASWPLCRTDCNRFKHLCTWQALLFDQ